MATTTGAVAGPLTTARSSKGRSVNTLPLMMPSVGLLLIWMIVPLVMTVWFSFRNYQLLNPMLTGWAGIEHYRYLLTDPSLWTAMLNTLCLVGWVLVITVGLGTLLAVL